MAASGKARAPVKAPIWSEFYTVSFSPNGASDPTDVDSSHGFSVARTDVGTFECTLPGVSGQFGQTFVDYANPPADGAAFRSSISSSSGNLVVTIKTQTSGADADHAAAAGRDVSILLVVKP